MKLRWASFQDLPEAVFSDVSTPVLGFEADFSALFELYVIFLALLQKVRYYSNFCTIFAAQTH